MAEGRADLLAEVAGLCRGAELYGGPMALQRKIMGDLCVDAGADLAVMERWIPIGLERSRPPAPPRV